MHFNIVFLYSRTLTDKESTPDSVPSIEGASNIDDELLKKIALGNLGLLKKFEDACVSNEDLSADTGNGIKQILFYFFSSNVLLPSKCIFFVFRLRFGHL